MSSFFILNMLVTSAAAKVATVPNLPGRHFALVIAVASGTAAPGNEAVEGNTK